jgi:hypothetical protein
MRVSKRLSLLAVALVHTSSAQQPPKVMTKVEVFLEGPDIPAGSFATKPKVMYRAGTRYCRIEEAPDPGNGIHGLAITNEPDAWMVNLVSKTAKHMVDPGPTFNCRLPIFPDADKDLEFGFELEYFKGKGAVPQKGPEMQAKSTTVYKVDVGNGTALALFTYGSPERPMLVSRVRGDKGEIFWFTGWGDLPFQPALFAKPEGVKIADQTR